jgi:hypothetical protein
MQATKSIIAISFCIAWNAKAAETNPDCLSHLGGGASDIACYDELAGQLQKENIETYRRLKNIIPQNKNQRLLSQYMLYQDQGLKFCVLKRDAENHWDFKADEKMSEHHYYDVIKYECIYDLRLRQRNFLANLGASK